MVSSEAEKVVVVEKKVVSLVVFPASVEAEASVAFLEAKKVVKEEAVALEDMEHLRLPHLLMEHLLLPHLLTMLLHLPHLLTMPLPMINHRMEAVVVVERKAGAFSAAFLSFLA